MHGVAMVDVQQTGARVLREELNNGLAIGLRWLGQVVVQKLRLFNNEVLSVPLKISG